MERRRLPIGIQTFGRIREEGYYYVDKTGYARRMAEEGGGRFFLSRPRRFGKSLFVDTLKELYEGSERLFRGLAVHDAWDWSRRRPVVRLSFAGGNFLFEFKVAARAAPGSRPAGADRGDGAQSPGADRGDAAQTAGADRGDAAQTAGGTARPPGAGRGDAAVDRPALAQLKARRYADKYRAVGRRVHLIGVEIGAETRDLTAFDVEPA